MKKRKIGISIILSLAFVILIGFQAFATNGNVIYTNDAGKFIFTPGSKYSPTDLFTEYKGVMPGDVLSQKINVRNNASDDVIVKIYMRSLGAADELSDDFLNQMKLTVRKASEDPLFEAPANEKAGLKDWVLLGTFSSGANVDLNLDLEVPTSLENEYANRIGYLDWEFMVEEYPNPDVPTGDSNNIIIWIIALIVAAVIIISIVIIFLVRNKKNKR